MAAKKKAKKAAKKKSCEEKEALTLSALTAPDFSESQTQTSTREENLFSSRFFLSDSQSRDPHDGVSKFRVARWRSKLRSY